MADSELCFMPARTLTKMMRSRQVSVEQVMRAFIDRIDRLNPKLNAICTYLPQLGLDHAKQLDQRLASGEVTPGPLFGLPIAIKDLALTRGIRTTFGSPIYQDFVPNDEALFVQRIRQAGAIIIGKTNVPEFGMGSQTFNPVFGKTRNPYDLSKTCGGSSGGAAVALAANMLPIADGSDLGGSLRNPASFCNVVGFRPSIGRVPDYPLLHGWATFATPGPMARDMQDLALLLSVLAGPDDRSPIALTDPGETFLQPLQRDVKGLRIGWSRNLGGAYEVEPVVNEICDASRGVFEQMGCIVEEDEPDMRDADEVFQILRAWFFASVRRYDYERHRDKLKDTAVWNIEKGLQLTGEDVARAERMRTAVYQRLRRYFEKHDFLVLPTVQVLPFDVEQPYVTQINGRTLENYIQWQGTCYALSPTGLPCISVPCGFSKDGLPVGLQIVGPARADFAVLQIAFAFEQATRHGERRPKLD